MHSSLLSIIFRLINFGVLIGIGYYLFKKYFKNGIDEKIVQKEAVVKGLEEQGYFLEAKVIHLENQRREQEKYAALMRQKIDDWRIAVAAQNNKKQEEMRVSADRIAEQVARINQTLQHERWRKTVLPRALADAKKKLTEQFSDSKSAQSYIYDTVNHLERI